MTLLMDQPVATGATLYPRGAAADPDRQAAEEFYQQGASVSHRAVTIGVVGPDGSLRRDWLASYMESQINRLLRLGPGWDGHRANPVATESVNAVMEVISHLATDLALPPLLFPLPDGGLQLEWHAGRESVEVEVDAGGDGHLLVTDESGTIVINAELEKGVSDALDQARRSIDHLSLRLQRSR